jgi:rubrerythrin
MGTKDWKLFKNKVAAIAPMGSVNPENKAQELNYIISQEKFSESKLKRAPQIYGRYDLQRNLIIPTTLVPLGMFIPGSTSEDLQASIDGETFEINEMYPAYKAVAQFQGEKGAEVSFNWALEAEKIHANLYQKVKQAVDQGKDVNLGPIQICSVCGYTVEGDAPEKCPICGTTKEKFRDF